VTVLFLLLTALGSASGRMEPPEWRVLGEGCDTRAPDADRVVDLEAGAPLRVVGHRRGFTSPPGGPVSTHLFLPEPDDVTLRRQRCEAPDPGSWVRTDQTCGDIPVLRWSGALRPGERYAVGHQASDVLQVRVSGTSRRRACPPPPVPPLHEEGPSRTETRSLTLPEGVVTVQQGASWLHTDAFARATGLPQLPGITRVPGVVPFDEDGGLDVTLTLSRRRIRTEYQADDGWHCHVSDQLSVKIDVDEHPGSWTVGGTDPSTVVDEVGRCER